MELRTCKNCGVEKELSPEFFRVSKGYLEHTCRKCNAEYKRSLPNDTPKKDLGTERAWFVVMPNDESTIKQTKKGYTSRLGNGL